MHKDIVFAQDVETKYKEDILKFIAEWNSYQNEFEFQTSGSTGPPKKIKFNRNQLIASANYTSNFFNLTKNDTLLLNLSPEFVAGKLMIVRALVQEAKLFVAPLKANPLDIENLPEKIKLAAFVPYQMEAILENQTTKNELKQIEFILIGGSSISSALEKKISALHSSSYMSFGMTETLTHFALRKLGDASEVYTCLPGITISADERGCLVVHKNGILKDDLVTNDLAEILSPTDFIWKGRIDNIINSGGVKIIPELVEKKIAQLFPSTDFYITSASHQKLGEEVVLLIESIEFPTEVLREQLQSILNKYELPKKIIFQSQFDRTHNNKVIRKKLG